jgi:hypothetical protein
MHFAQDLFERPRRGMKVCGHPAFLHQSQASDSDRRRPVQPATRVCAVNAPSSAGPMDAPNRVAGRQLRASRAGTPCAAVHRKRHLEGAGVPLQAGQDRPHVISTDAARQQLDPNWTASPTHATDPGTQSGRKTGGSVQSGRLDLNQRPFGPQPNALQQRPRSITMGRRGMREVAGVVVRLDRGSSNLPGRMRKSRKCGVSTSLGTPVALAAGNTLLTTWEHGWELFRRRTEQ